jgi:hypothetical protein
VGYRPWREEKFPAKNLFSFFLELWGPLHCAEALLKTEHKLGLSGEKKTHETYPSSRTACVRARCAPCVLELQKSQKRMRKGGPFVLSGIFLLSTLTRSASFAMKPALGEGKAVKPSDRFIKVMRDVYGDWSATRTTPNWRPTPLPYGEAGELQLSDKTIQRRYLWTDAFGVLNFVSYARMTDGEERGNALKAGRCAATQKPRVTIRRRAGVLLHCTTFHVKM